MKISFLSKIYLIVICLILFCDLNASALIETIAGTNSTSGFSGDSEIATSATLRSPAGVCFDTASTPNLYIADTSNNIVRMVCNTTGTYFGSSYTQGNIYTIAGSGPYGSTGSYLGSGVAAASSSAKLKSPAGICVDNAGNLYIADAGNNRIRMVYNGGTVFGSSFYTQGYIYTIAGGAGSPSLANAGYTGDGTSATAAATTTKLRSPFGLCLDSSGNMYISDTSNNVIRMVYNSGTVFGSSSYTQGYIYTIVGYNPSTGSAATSGYGGDGGVATSSSVLLNQPRGICLDNAGNLYIADRSNTVVRMVCNTAGTYFGSSRTQGYIYTVAGTVNTFSPFASALNAPYGVCIDSSGNLYITNQGSHSIRMVSTNGTMSNLAGDGTAGNTGDSDAASSARVSGPQGICVDTASIPNVYIADTNNHCIREIISTITYNVSSGSQAFSTSRSAVRACITGGGTTVLSSTNTFDNIEINNGIVSVSSKANLGNASNPAVTFNATSGSAILDITAAMDPGALTLTTNGTVQVDDVTATLSTAPAGTGTLSKTGTGILAVSSDLHSSTTPITVLAGTLQVSSGSALPTAAISVASGAILDLIGPGASDYVQAGTIPGITTILSGGILQVNSGVSAAGIGDAFSGTLLFNSGAILNLNGGIWARDITIGTPL